MSKFIILITMIMAGLAYFYWKQSDHDTAFIIFHCYVSALCVMAYLEVKI